MFSRRIGPLLVVMLLAGCGGAPATSSPATSSPAPSKSATLGQGTSGTASSAPAASSGKCAAQGTSVINHAGPQLTQLPYLVNVRAAASPCGDQVILDVMQGSDFNYTVKYAPVTELTSQTPVRLRGGATLSVTVAASAVDQSLTSSYLPDNESELVDATEMQQVRQVAWAGSFEGSSRIGIGLAAKVGFAVQIVPASAADQPSHLVITFSSTHN